jgi:rhodanese-related sulfurtransferase
MIQEINCNELNIRLKQPHNKPVLLDVRNDDEFELCHIPGSIHIPLHNISQFMETLNKNDELVCICHHGYRSFKAALLLEQNGFSMIFNLKGGIDEWAKNIDPTMKQY